MPVCSFLRVIVRETGHVARKKAQSFTVCQSPRSWCHCEQTTRHTETSSIRAQTLMGYWRRLRIEITQRERENYTPLKLSFQKVLTLGTPSRHSPEGSWDNILTSYSLVFAPHEYSRGRRRIVRTARINSIMKESIGRGTLRYITNARHIQVEHLYQSAIIHHGMESAPPPWCHACELIESG